MKIVPTLAICTLLMLISCISFAQNKATAPAPSGTEAREKIAADYLDNMVKGNFEASRKDFSKTMADAFTTERQQEKWRELTTKIGTFQKVEYTRQELREGNYEIIKRCHFSAQNVSVILHFNEENQVIGLYYKL